MNELTRWRKRAWLITSTVGLAILGLDYATGPYIFFPVTFVAPVAAAGWWLGCGAAVGQSVVLVGARLGMSRYWGHPDWGLTVAAGNAVINLCVLVGISVLVCALARSHRALAARVRTLEGILPICSFCKKIRDDSGNWQPVEGYVAARTSARFSHGICQPCGREHYPDVFPPEAPPAVTSHGS